MTQEQLLKRLLLLKEQPDLIKPFTLEELQELMFMFLNHVSEVKNTVEAGTKKSEQDRSLMAETVAKLEKETRAEIYALAQEAMERSLGKIGLDKEEIKSLIAKEVARIESQIPQMPEEFDASDLYNLLNKHDDALARIEMLTTIENIRNGLEALPEDDKLVIEAIKGLPEALQNLQQQRQTATAIIARSLSQLSDVNLSGLVHGSTISWNSTTNQWVVGTSGAGDVIGPASSTDNHIVVFNGTTGKVIKDSGVTTSSFATSAQGAKADTAVQPADIANFETTTQLNTRDTNNRNRANHTGTQPASTITGLGAVATSNDYNDLDNLPDLSAFDNISEHATFSAFPATGVSDKFYLAQDTGILYRWAGSAYVVISAQLALGETSSTAYRGDRGKIAYDHAQQISGNPHNVTKSEIGLGNVDNTSDADKPISTATQTALDAKVGYTTTTITSSATPTPTGDAMRNELIVTALAVNATISAPTGTATAGNMLKLIITATGATRTVGYNTALTAGNVTRTTSIPAGETLVQVYQYQNSSWVCHFDDLN